jgi:hypothetical protein
MDYSKIKANIELSIMHIDGDSITLSQINQILRTANAVKTIHQKPIKFWTPQLKKAIRLQNKARKKIGKARKRKEDTTDYYREYKNAQKNFRKLFKDAKRKYNIKQIEKACQDQTGAEFYRIINN